MRSPENDRRRPLQNAAATSDHLSRSLATARRVRRRLQEALEAVRDALAEARDGLTPDEHRALIAITVNTVAAEAARGLDLEWRAT